MTELVPATKVCPDCGEAKSLADYYRNRSRHDGVDTYCKPCKVARVKRSQARRRQEMGDAAYRAKQAQNVRLSRLNPEVRERNRASVAARDAALEKLRELHPDDFAHLLQRERYERGLL